MTPTKPLEAPELEAHIMDCASLLMDTYARFQETGNPADRAEAREFLRCMQQAILARPDAIQAARHAAFERAITEQCAYFISDAAASLGQRAVA